MGEKKKGKTFNAVPADLRYWKGYKYYIEPDTLYDENGPYIVNGERIVSRVGKNPTVGTNLPATISQYIFTDPTGQLEPDTLYVETPPYTTVGPLKPKIISRSANSIDKGSEYDILKKRYNEANNVVISAPVVFSNGGKSLRLMPKKFLLGGTINNAIDWIMDHPAIATAINPLLGAISRSSKETEKPTAEDAKSRYRKAANVIRKGKYTDKDGKVHQIVTQSIIANNRPDAGPLTTGALLLLVDIDGNTMLVENPLYSFFATPEYRRAFSTDEDQSEYLTLMRRLLEAAEVARVNDVQDGEVFDNDWWLEYAPFFGLIPEEKVSKKKNGGIAVKINRGNGIDGYALANNNDINWVRNQDGRYVPLLKEFAKGGRVGRNKNATLELIQKNWAERDNIYLPKDNLELIDWWAKTEREVTGRNPSDNDIDYLPVLILNVNEEDWIKFLDNLKMYDLQLYANGGKSSVKKYEDGDEVNKGNTAFNFMQLLAGDIKKISLATLSEEDELTDEEKREQSYNNMMRNAKINRRKTQLNNVSSVANNLLQSLYNNMQFGPYGQYDKFINK